MWKFWVLCNSVTMAHIHVFVCIAVELKSISLSEHLHPCCVVIPLPDMDSLKVTNAIAAGMLSQGQRNIHLLFQPILHFTRWQQAPVARLMLDFLPLITLLQEVCWRYGYLKGQVPHEFSKLMSAFLSYAYCIQKFMFDLMPNPGFTEVNFWHLAGVESSFLNSQNSSAQNNSCVLFLNRIPERWGAHFNYLPLICMFPP